jgi:amphi-Trp domain-containing protein
MGDSKYRFRHQSLQDNQSIAAYLEALTRGFQEGRISMSNDDGHVEFRPDGLIHFALDANEKRGRVRVKLEFSWRAPKALKPGLTIEAGPASPDDEAAD